MILAYFIGLVACVQNFDCLRYTWVISRIICIIKMNSSLQKFTLLKFLAYPWVFKLLNFRPAEKMLSLSRQENHKSKYRKPVLFKVENHEDHMHERGLIEERLYIHGLSVADWWTDSLTVDKDTLYPYSFSGGEHGDHFCILLKSFLSIAFLSLDWPLTDPTSLQENPRLSPSLLLGSVHACNIRTCQFSTCLPYLESKHSPDNYCRFLIKSKSRNKGV